MNVNREQYMSQLREAIVQNMNIQVPEQLKETDRLYHDLNIDSIMVLQLVVDLEEVFGVTVPEEDLDPAVFETVGTLVSFIEQLVSEKVG
ncbi:phosphopantetheine-binding protein [Paenibacillus sp. MMS18-CY102]|uniref:phosphopantetheine-binding protein n=1 Tax=Paenibacillus sp. MMS18-CY102 TaxID=2682849 RepID=UPI0013664107|nr:phosphopantetheine-binding protein [Paenibacillus sp. MMS18-CY102]MWC29847.1 acyl carrier protein [Paenibacillus sp. MMS18-CY102]